MHAPNLLVICLNAFLAVLVLLSLLALTMRVLIAALPARETASMPVAAEPDTATMVDPALAAAVTMAAQATFPGLHVTRIEEETRKEPA